MLIYSSKRLAFNFLFWWYLCLVWHQVNDVFIECLWECPFPLNILKEFEKYLVFLCIFSQICLQSCVILDFFFVRSFQVTDSVSLPVIGLFRLPISSWFSFGIFLETCPFFLSYIIFWHIIVDSILLCLGRLVGWLYFCGSSCDFCSFHFSFYSFGSLLFSSWWVWPESLSILFAISKNQLMVVLIFDFSVFLISNLLTFISSWSLLFPSFCWL